MQQPVQQSLTRRSLLAGSAGLAGAAALTRSRAFAQQKAQLGAPAASSPIRRATGRRAAHRSTPTPT
ncbi:MAG: hypothetical protein WB611_10105 [Stellaceae bacterium]